jgi:uncharacterized protein YllA (UPF0747 family)
MRIAKRVAWSELGWQRAASMSIQDGAPPASRPPTLEDLERVASRPPMQPALARDLAREDPVQADAWEQLADPSARVVITGQQPGAAGGTLLVLYKAATVVALADLAGRRLRRPVVPVFWNAADDVDFDEIARVAWPTDDDLLFFEMSPQHRRPEGFVGDLPSSEDDALARAMLKAGPAASGRVGALPVQARDHGDWVGTLLRRLFPGLVVLDGRSLALRRHAAPLFGSYVGKQGTVRAALESAGQEVESAGLTRAISPASARQGLFLVRDGQRLKSRDGIADVEAAIRTAPETVSPNVVMRPMLQDLLLPVIAQVTGPAEIAYLHELQALRPLLGVPEPALVPRLSLTLLDAAVWDSLERLDLPTADVLRAPRDALRARARQAVQGERQRLAAAAERFTAELHASRPALSERARERAVKRMAALQAELGTDVDDGAVQALLAGEPALQRLENLVRPRQLWQERVVAGLWLLAHVGEQAPQDLVEMSGAHLERVERGALEHLVAVA